MLIIDTEVRPSPIHGTGLFTLEKLTKGQLIWAMHKSLDSAFTKSHWDLLPHAAKTYLHTYMYWSARLERYVACLDNSRHMNHVETPNTESVYYNSLDDMPEVMRACMSEQQWEMIHIAEGFVIATRDIYPHEELSCNYNIDFPDHGGAGTLDFLKKR